MSFPQTDRLRQNPEDGWDVPGYDVIELIGRGGMGAVYKARQHSLNRVVAVKILSTEIDNEQLDFATRFRVEAMAMARLAHPNIVSVHDFGETASGRFFYIMEFVEGTDLAKKLQSTEKLPVSEALRIILTVCEALERAHSEGVVHRDIKPSNILIHTSGLVKVADFGLAKMDDPSTATLTLSGTTMGSHGYAAPEVFARASTADHRADIYSLGVLLYEMLTGSVPRGMFKLPSEKVPELGTGFDSLICQALEEDREERFQSVAELRTALAELEHSHALLLVPQHSLTPRPSSPRPWRWMIGSGVAAAVTAACLLAPFSTEVSPSANALTSQVTPEPETQDSPAAEFHGHRYQYISGACTWKQAEANAASLGGHLVTLTSPEENHWVWTQFSPYLPPNDKRALTERGWWVGGRPLETSGQWKWINEEPFDYTCWSILKPPPARTPRLRQHNNGGGGRLSAWSPVHYSQPCGYVVEWDEVKAGSSVSVPRKVIDLLPQIDVERDAISGAWTRDGSDLVVKAGPITEAGTTRLQLPYVPPEEYDFEIEFTSEAGINSIQQILSAQGRPFTWQMDVKIEGGVKSGFNLINKIRVSDRKEGTAMHPHFLAHGRRHVSRLEVRKNGLRAIIDGREIVRWRAGQDGFLALDIAAPEALRDKLHLGLAAVNRTVRFHRISVREFTGSGQIDLTLKTAAK